MLLDGLTVGKPLGFALASALAVGLHLAERPRAYSWRQLTGAGALAGVGFTMSLFIAGHAFPRAEDFAVAKIAVFTASILSAVLGAAVLWRTQVSPDRHRVDILPSDTHTIRDSLKKMTAWPGVRCAVVRRDQA